MKQWILKFMYYYVLKHLFGIDGIKGTEHSISIEIEIHENPLKKKIIYGYCYLSHSYFYPATPKIKFIEYNISELGGVGGCGEIRNIKQKKSPITYKYKHEGD